VEVAEVLGEELEKVVEEGEGEVEETAELERKMAGADEGEVTEKREGEVLETELNSVM